MVEIIVLIVVGMMIKPVGYDMFIRHILVGWGWVKPVPVVEKAVVLPKVPEGYQVVKVDAPVNPVVAP